MPDVLSERDGAIARVTLNRPEALNAITTSLASELEDALRTLGEDERVHVIVVRGAGGTFSVGGDFKHLQELRARGRDAMAELFDAFGAACASIAELPVPVVAAVEGHALAGGFELMLAADVAIVRDDARIGDHHSNFAMVPGGGSTQRLARLAGRARALGLILTGDSITGAEAVQWGLAYRAAPADGFDGAVGELAEQLAGKDRRAQATIKALVRGGLDGSLDEGLARERAAVVDHLTAEGALDGFARKGAHS